MITINGHDLDDIRIDGVPVKRIQDAATLEIMWEKTSPEPVTDYFYLVNESYSTNTIRLHKNGSPTSTVIICYSYDKLNWNKWDENGGVRTLILQPNEKVYFKNTGSGLSKHYADYYNFSSTSYFSAGGDVTTLITENGTNTLTDFCFFNLFNGCTSLTSAPSLKATTLANYCYNNMFEGCTSLTSAPALPATKLANSCYASMFSGCTSLKSAPSLKATTLAYGCYYWMFKGCTSLTYSPELPATTLVEDCYNSMFEGCNSLKSAPSIRATELEMGCCAGMFRGCTSLTYAPSLQATKLAYGCYIEMFYECFSLNEVTTYANDISATDCTQDWLYGVSVSGTFYNLGGATYSEGPSGIPSGWIETNS